MFKPDRSCVASLSSTPPQAPYLSCLPISRARENRKLEGSGVSRMSFRRSDPEPLAHCSMYVCYSAPVASAAPMAPRREGLNFRLPPLTPPGQPSPHSLLPSLVRDKEVCLGVGVENWELPQSQTERKGKSQEESQWVRVTAPAVITWQDVDWSASHTNISPLSWFLFLG